MSEMDALKRQQPAMLGEKESEALTVVAAHGMPAGNRALSKSFGGCFIPHHIAAGQNLYPADHPNRKILALILQ